VQPRIHVLQPTHAPQALRVQQPHLALLRLRARLPIHVQRQRRVLLQILARLRHPAQLQRLVPLQILALRARLVLRLTHAQQAPSKVRIPIA
jgi:hypothetical protein